MWLFCWYFTMSLLSEDETENFSAHITKSEQWAYMKIETLRGNTALIIHASLKEVCRNVTLNRSTVQLVYINVSEMGEWAQKKTHDLVSISVIDNTSIAIVAIDKDAWVIVREIEAETGIPRTTFHHIYWTYFQENNGCTVGTTCIDRQLEYLKRFRTVENFFNWIIAMEETWIWYFKHELKFQRNLSTSQTSLQRKIICHSV